MILIVDHFDSFSYNLDQLLGGLGLAVRVVRCDEVTPAAILAARPGAVVLSPGPRGPRDTGVTLPFLAEPAAARVPVIGVCLGFQAMALAWGARVEPAPEVVHGKTLELFPAPHGLFAGLPSPLVVGRYHSLCVPAASLPAGVEILAEHRGMAMLALDRERPWAGMQFHPESFLTPEGPRLMDRLLALLTARSGPGLEKGAAPDNRPRPPGDQA